MALKIAINGFGRIGRSVFRALYESGATDIEVVAINDLSPNETMAHLLRFDSVHGRFNFPVEVVDGGITVDGKFIKITEFRDPTELPWGDVDIAYECTGIFTSHDKASLLLKSGAKRVLISAPGKGADKTVVYGVNHDTLTADDLIVSNASCTTNCLAPVASVLEDLVGIETGYMTTIHAYTGDQPTHDRPHSDLYRGRAAALSMIPTSTGAARAISLVLPQLEGRLDGSAVRVPTANVSMVDLKIIPKKTATADAINAAMKEAAEGKLAGILAYEERPLVSVDYNHTTTSSNFAAPQTAVTDGGLVRIVSWYDNEWGFSNRMLDTGRAMGALL